MDNKLDKVLAELAELKAQLGLGFGPPPVTRRVHCNRQHGGLWYFWNGEAGGAEIISAPALTGYARQLDIKVGEYKGKPTHNLELLMDCGPQSYILTAGLQSTFSRGLLLALGMLTRKHFQGPITVAPRAGDEEKVLLCSVWAGKNYVKHEWTDDENVVRACFKRAQQNIREANTNA
jgi:hypothetical protein